MTSEICTTETFYENVIRKFIGKLKARKQSQNGPDEQLMHIIEKSMRAKLQNVEPMYRALIDGPNEFEKHMHQHAFHHQLEEPQEKVSKTIIKREEDQDDDLIFFEMKGQGKQPVPEQHSEPQEIQRSLEMDLGSELQQDIDNSKQIAMHVLGIYEGKNRISNSKVVKLQLRNVFIKIPKMSTELIFAYGEITMERRK